MIISWTAELATGHPEIDADHQVLTDIIARLSELIDGNEHEKIGDILCQLTEYVTLHFGREEFIMHSIRYPEADAHLLAHCDFFANLTRFVYLYETDQVGLGQDILNYLTLWLTSHEANEDKLLVRYWRSVQDDHDTASSPAPS